MVFQNLWVTVVGHAWTPELIVTDYEVGLMNAIQTVYPGTKLGGCYFHFTQCLQRKINELGLKTPYETDPNLSKNVRYDMKNCNDCVEGDGFELC